MPLYHVPTVLALIALTWMARRGVVSDASMICIVIYLWLHILGSRYTYTNVPYDDWTQACFGWTITEKFECTRNHYDRLVHFLYGVLSVIPQVELLRRMCRLGKFSACILSITLVTAMGGLYEIFEWLLTLVASPEEADRYNGQQGDMWDAQKDMALAMLGAMIMTVFVAVFGQGLTAMKGTRPGRGSVSWR